MSTQALVFSPPRPLVARFWPMLLTFACYLLPAYTGLSFTTLDGIETPSWAPAGVAVAALLLGGRRLWPAIFAASFLAYATNGASIPLAVVIAAGNTLAGLAGAWTLQRMDFSPALDRVRDIGRLVIAGAVCAMVGSLVGVASLALAGEIPASDIAYRLSLWWTGDATSVYIVAPVIFAAVSSIQAGRFPSGRRLVELVVALTALAGMVVFLFSDESRRFPAFLVPFWAWTTFRFRALGSSLATVIIASMAQYYTARGEVLIEGATLMRNIQASQMLPSIVGLSLLLLGAALAERDAAHAVAEHSLLQEQEVARQLRQIDASKDRMLAAVSHELNTPLTSILGLSQLLNQGADTMDATKRREMLGRLESEASRLDELLADLLDVERLRLGLVEPRYDTFDLADVVRGALDRPESQLDLQSVRIEGDAAKIERIVDNLVGNADKYAGDADRIMVTVRSVEDGALIVVDDNGDGIPDELKQSVFEPFDRGGADITAIPGTGIGLSLVKHFTELHGGRTWVEDRPGGGASFRVFLPTART